MSNRYRPLPLWFLFLWMPLLAQAQIDTSLLTAIRQNNPAGVQAALKARANPNATDSLGATPLMWACYRADTAVVKILVKAGAKTKCRGVIRTDTSTYYGNLTGLAAGLNKLPLLRYLLETLKLPVNEPEYNPNTKKNDGWTPAEWAANYGHLPVLKYLAERGTDLRVGNGNPMALAVQREQAAVVAFLLDRGLVLDKQHPRYGDVVGIYFGLLIGLSKQYDDKEDGKNALLFEQMQAIYGDNVSRQDTVYAAILNNLAGSYESIGQFEKALPLYQESLTILEQVISKQHPQYAITLNNIAVLYRNRGEYDKALPLFLKASNIITHTHGKQNLTYTVTLKGLADLYQSMGQYEKALLLLAECRTIQEQISEKLNPSYASTLNSLGQVYASMGQYEKALPLYEEASKIIDKGLGRLNPQYVTLRKNMADLYKSMANPKISLLLYQEAYLIALVLGKEQPLYASTLGGLASLYQLTGEYEKALPLYEESRSIKKQVLGKQHPSYASTVNDLALLYEWMSQHEKALPLYLEARQQYRTQLLSQIAIMNETALAEFQQTYNFQDPLYSFSYKTRTQALAGQHYTDALLSKSVGLLATQQLNRLLAQTTDTVAIRIGQQLLATKQYLNRQLTLPLIKQQGVDSLEKQGNALEQQFILRLPEYGKTFNALRVEWQQVQATLNPNEATIEFVSFPYWHKTLTDSTLYAAVVLRPGWATPRFVVLAEQKQLDTLLTTGSASAFEINRLYRGGEAEGDKNQLARGLTLSRIIWQPLDSLLQGVDTVYVSPTGRLHQIALGALPNPADTSQRMADRFQIRQVGSTRMVALRTAQSEQPLAKNNLWASVYGGIVYDVDSLGLVRQKQPNEVQQRLPPCDATRSGIWDYLPGTKTEVDTLRKLLPGSSTTILTGKAATEGSVKALSGRSPRILHIATHGFFCPDLPKPKTDGLAQLSDERNRFQVSENPLLWSGLVMAGANGTPIEGVDDGILTASELSNLNLSGTELVVLSACKTGLGQVKGSEGVYGLQRAVKMAGARYLLMSLWRVADKETAEYMELFYKKLLDNGSVPAAYAHAQSQMRARYPEESFKWAAFVLVE